MTIEFIWQGIGFLVVAGSIYGGIRADIRNIHERVLRAEKEIDKAHDRIDSLGARK